MTYTRDDYVPYPHSYLAGMYRIPVWVNDDGFTVCISSKSYRHYDHTTIPDRIKALLSMIHAIPHKPRESHDINPTSAYVNMQDPRLDEIGWRVSDDLYILILGEGFLFDLRKGTYG